MKKLTALSATLILTACSTVDMAANYFYDNVVDEYCKLDELNRAIIRMKYNEGRANQIKFLCVNEPN